MYMGGAVVCLFSKFVLMFVWFIMCVMMGFRGGYYYYLPSEVGSESPRACPTATSASGWSHTPVTDLQRVYNGRPEEDEEGYAPSHYGASVVRLFPRTNPIHVDMDVLMENKWRQVQWGINWQFTSELETLLDVGGCEGMPCILCHPAEVQDGDTPPQHVFIQP